MRDKPQVGTSTARIQLDRFLGLIGLLAGPIGLVAVIICGFYHHGWMI